jgi:membrane protein DedA with SNARE-associated domain
VLSLVLSTIAFFVAGYFLKRWADENEFPKGMTRSLGIFVLALAIAYGIAWLADKMIGIAGP